MKKSIFLRLFFIINLLLALILSLRAAEEPSTTVPLRDALTFCKEAMRTFVRDNDVKRSPKLLKHDFKIARHVLKAHSDDAGRVSLIIVMQLLQAYQQWLRINYPKDFPGLLNQSIPSAGWQPPASTSVVPSRASRR